MDVLAPTGDSEPAAPASPAAKPGVPPAPYGAPSSPAPYTYAPPAPPHNALAWVSLGLAIGFMMFGVLCSIPAIVCGHIARAQIRRTGEQGAAAALTGLVLGYACTALAIVGVGGFLLWVIVMNTVTSQ